MYGKTSEAQASNGIAWHLEGGTSAIEALLTEALEQCCSENAAWATDENERTVNRARSQHWVEKVGTLMQSRYYPQADGFRVFSKLSTANRVEFTVNEYLYDLTIIKVGTVISAKRGVHLTYPIRTIWHIESEFDEGSSRSSVVDFGKLLMSGAENKLMVLPANTGIEPWALSTLAPLCAEAQGNFYLAFVPHPGAWAKDVTATVRVHAC